MSIDTSSSLAAILAFSSWTLLHTCIMLGHRSLLINTGRAKPNGFGPSRDEPQTTFYGRVCASHANCVENLVVFAAVVLTLHLAGGPDVSTLAWRTVYLRVGQSLVHWWDTSETAVTARFLFFVGQLYCIGVMIYRSM